MANANGNQKTQTTKAQTTTPATVTPQAAPQAMPEIPEASKDKTRKLQFQGTAEDNALVAKLQKDWSEKHDVDFTEAQIIRQIFKRGLKAMQAEVSNK